jgi:hypothetical protein
MKKTIEPKHFSAVCGALLASDAKSAIKIIDEKTVVKATFHNKPTKRNRREEMIVTCGEPDYRVREFIKKAKKAGEPFPVKKIQFRAWPVKKAVKKASPAMSITPDPAEMDDIERH